MACEKILLLWQQSWYAFRRTPIIMWLGLILLHLQRYYYALLTSYAFFIPICYLAAAYFFRNNLVGIVSTLLILSCIIYLMRPTVGLKTCGYLWHYCTLENITSVLAVTFVYLLSAALLPKFFLGLIFLAALCSFSFVYDAAGSIPDKVGYALARTGYFFLYKAPIMIIFFLLSTASAYSNFVLVGIMFNIFFLYPLLAALVMVVYISALHDTYELYYAE